METEQVRKLRNRVNCLWAKLQKAEEKYQQWKQNRRLPELGRAYYSRTVSKMKYNDAKRKLDAVSSSNDHM